MINGLEQKAKDLDKRAHLGDVSISLSTAPHPSLIEHAILCGDKEFLKQLQEEQQTADPAIKVSVSGKFLVKLFKTICDLFD